MATTKKELDDANARIAELEAKADPLLLLEMERAENARLRDVIEGLRAERDDHRDRAQRAETGLEDARAARADYQQREDLRREMIRDLYEARSKLTRGFVGRIAATDQGDSEAEAEATAQAWEHHVVLALRAVAEILREKGATFGEHGFEGEAREAEGMFGFSCPETRQGYAVAREAIIERVGILATRVQAASAGWAATRE